MFFQFAYAKLNNLFCYTQNGCHMNGDKTATLN